MLAKVCPKATCTHVQPCPNPDHAPKAWSRVSPRNQNRLSGGAQQARAKRVLRRWDGICHVCGRPGANEADHVVAVSEGGADVEENMRPIHKDPCHREKTAAESQRAKARRAS